jgi:hypothetical protein
LAQLAARGLITLAPIMLTRGHASEVTVYQVRFGSDEWLALAPVVAKVHLPERASRPRAKRVPPHLLHLFWNTASTQLDVDTSAPYIARRLLTTFDPDGLAWGTVNASRRCLDAQTARNHRHPQRLIAQTTVPSNAPTQATHSAAQTYKAAWNDSAAVEQLTDRERREVRTAD